MSPRALIALWLGLCLAGGTAALASDLGTAGPFRWIGGTACPASAPDRCAPPAVDASLPVGERVHALTARSRAFLDLLRMADARASLDEALRLDPDNVEALTLRGRLALTEGSGDSARIDIDHALRIAPSDPDLLATRALFEFSVTEPKQAFADLDAALVQRPNDTDMLFIRARLHLMMKDLAAAFADLSTSLAYAPDDLRALQLRGIVQLARRDFDLATLDADRILAVNPGNIQALAIRAEARVGAGDDVGAIEAYTMLLDRAGGTKALFVPQFHEALVTRGRLYAKLRRFEEAKRDLQMLMAQSGRQGLLQLQLFLRANGYPNVEISGERTAALDTALGACFGDRVCGPNLFR